MMAKRRKPTSTSATETFGVDAPRVTADEAVELVVYHLSMAACYFEATPHDACRQLNEEMRRVMLRDVAGDHVVNASSTFVWMLHEAYEAMDGRD